MGVNDGIGDSEDYEVPTLVEVGTVRGLTRGHLFAPGQDSLSFVPIPGLFGSH